MISLKFTHVQILTSDLRKIIEKHFIPTQEQRKDNAEIPTPVKLVDDMINKLSHYDPGYFTQKNKTFEPCCGKEILY